MGLFWREKRGERQLYFERRVRKRADFRAQMADDWQRRRSRIPQLKDFRGGWRPGDPGKRAS